jgi:hypothetical protein
MNKPSAIAAPQQETLPEIPIKNDSGLLEYIMLGVGVIVLLFVVSLLMKG